MSRIGRMPITVPAGVEVTIAENNVVTVKGPKGTLTQALRPEMILEQGHGLAMVEMNPTVGQGIFGVVFNDIYSRIKPYDPEVYTSHRLTAVTDTGVTVEDMATGETKTIAADTVVGELKNNFVQVGKEDGATLYQVEIAKNQVPSLVLSLIHI